MRRKGKIAFVNSRTYTGGSGLISMPFAFNTVLKLQANWAIDLFLGETPNPEYETQLSNAVNVHYIHKALGRPYFLKDIDLLRRCLLRCDYVAVFGVGQVGVHVAHVLAKLSRCPLILFSDEFPSSFGHTRWSDYEAKALRRADVVLFPDINRARTLCAEVPGIESKAFVELLNTPLRRTSDPPVINWHERIGLPGGSVPLICAGGMGDHNQIPELLCSVKSWPGKYVLVLRGNNPNSAMRYRDSLRHLHLPDRIFWYCDSLRTEEFDSLLRYCSISFALYRPQGSNMIEMGKASGKLLRSVSLGVPVIATRFPSLAFVESSGIGVLVDHPSEIADAIESIESARDVFRHRCAEYTRSCLSYEIGWDEFRGRLARATGLNL